MEECRLLKSQIEKLIQHGYLGRFVRRKEGKKQTTEDYNKRDRSQTPSLDYDHEQDRSGNYRRSQPRPMGWNPSHQGMIATIERPTKRQDLPITFTDEDYTSTVRHLNDLMVISVVMADYKVERDARPQPKEDLKEIQVSLEPHQKTKIGASMDLQVEGDLVWVLCENWDTLPMPSFVHIPRVLFHRSEEKEIKRREEEGDQD
ncbi:hypothetical protein CR513_35043, partial [Mucuna pruriens]